MASRNERAKEPPAAWLGLKEFRYFLHELTTNPDRTKKKILHKIAPKRFSGPRRRRVFDLKNENQLIVQDPIEAKILQEGSSTKPAVRVDTEQKTSSPHKLILRNKRLKEIGGFGKVYLAEMLTRNNKWEEVAVKVQVLKNTPNSCTNFWTNMMYKKRIDYISALSEVAAMKKITGSRFVLELKTEALIKGSLLIVTDYAHFGDLTNVLEKSTYFARHIVDLEGKYSRSRIPIFLIRFLAAPIMLALQHIHDKHYIHKDVKPQNVLIFNDGTPKLADFGTMVIEQNDMNDADPLAIGSSFYMAPETVCMEKFNKSLDTWQMGISLLTLCFGMSPYHYMTDKVFWTSKTLPKSRQGKHNIIVSEQMRKLHEGNPNTQPFLFQSLHLLDDKFQNEEVEDWHNFRDFVKLFVVRSQYTRSSISELLLEDYIAPFARMWQQKKFSKDVRKHEVQEWMKALSGVSTRLKK